MIFCSECGAANEPGSGFCYECGAVLPTASVAKKSKSLPKPLLIGGAALLVVLLVVGVVMLILNGGKKDLDTAFDRTLTAFRGGETRTQLQRFGDELDLLLKEGDYTMTLTAADLSLTTNYSRDAEVMTGTVTILGRDLAYSLDTKSLQFSIPGQFDNAYSVKLKKVDELLSNPLIAPYIGTYGSFLGKNTDLFAKKDLETLFREAAGDEYDALRKSLEIKELDEKELNGQNCQVYEITWSGKALTDFLAALGGVGSIPELRELFISLTPDIGSECRCYVNNDYIIGLEFTGAGAQCMFTLEGRENPWDAFTLTVRSVYGETAVYTGGLVRTGSAMDFRLENDTGILLAFSYDDATGDFALATRDDGQILSGRLQTRSYLGLTLYIGTPEGPQELSFTMAPLTSTPAPLSANDIDLLDMSVVDLTRLLLDLGISIG